jgi:adenine-specific DNA-methyltransferase
VIQRLHRAHEGTLGLTTRETAEDLGFRVYSLAQSSYKRWQDYAGDSTAVLEGLFDQFETPLVSGWTPANLLTEVLLLQGFPLDSSIVALGDFTQNMILRVSSDACAHSLYVCLDPVVADLTIGRIALDLEDVFVCLDSALSDEGKQRLADVCALQTI